MTTAVLIVVYCGLAFSASPVYYRLTRFCRPGTRVQWSQYGQTFIGEYVRKSSVRYHRCRITVDPELASWVGREVVVDPRRDGLTVSEGVA